MTNPCRLFVRWLRLRALPIPFPICIKNARRILGAESGGLRVRRCALREKKRERLGEAACSRREGEDRAPCRPGSPPFPDSSWIPTRAPFKACAHFCSAPLGKMRHRKLLLCLLFLSAPCLGLVRGLFLFGEPEFSYKRSNCKPIPASLLLCRGIEYPNMRLPNLLGHETMQEVLEQAGAWIPLVQKQCHPDTRKFLCSLFAPVCIVDLDETIEPCHSLCEQVKNSCAPVMSAFGFPWPDMLDCSRFPQDNDLCIPLASSDHVLPTPKEAPKVCDACKNKNEDDNEIVENLCRNDFAVAKLLHSIVVEKGHLLLKEMNISLENLTFQELIVSTVEKSDKELLYKALKIKVKEIAYINGDTKITPETKSKTIYKLNGVTERDLKKTVLWLKGGLQCTCDEMNDINAPYLVMGQRLAGELVITSVKRWQKGQRAFKRFSRSIRKLQC